MRKFNDFSTLYRHNSYGDTIKIGLPSEPFDWFKIRQLGNYGLLDMDIRDSGNILRGLCSYKGIDNWCQIPWYHVDNILFGYLYTRIRICMFRGNDADFCNYVVSRTAPYRCDYLGMSSRLRFDCSFMRCLMFQPTVNVRPVVFPTKRRLLREYHSILKRYSRCIDKKDNKDYNAYTTVNYICDLYQKAVDTTNKFLDENKDNIVIPLFSMSPEYVAYDMLIDDILITIQGKVLKRTMSSFKKDVGMLDPLIYEQGLINHFWDVLSSSTEHCSKEAFFDYYGVEFANKCIKVMDKSNTPLIFKEEKKC